MLQETVLESFNAMRVSDKANFLTHTSANLSQELYQSKNVKGLETLRKNFEVLSEYAQNLYTELRIEEMTREISCQLEELTEIFKEKGGLSEEFVIRLEELLNYAHDCLEDDPKDEAQELAEKSAMENLKMLMWESEQRAANL